VYDSVSHSLGRAARNSMRSAQDALPENELHLRFGIQAVGCQKKHHVGITSDVLLHDLDEGFGRAVFDSIGIVASPDVDPYRFFVEGRACFIDRRLLWRMKGKDGEVDVGCAIEGPP